MQCPDCGHALVNLVTPARELVGHACSRCGYDTRTPATCGELTNSGAPCKVTANPCPYHGSDQ